MTFDRNRETASVCSLSELVTAIIRLLSRTIFTNSSAMEFRSYSRIVVIFSSFGFVSCENRLFKTTLSSLLTI